MNHEQLGTKIEQLVRGDISAADHKALQQRLKDDPAARAAFRATMDLEAALRTWAAEHLDDSGVDNVRIRAKTTSGDGRLSLRESASWIRSFAERKATIVSARVQSADTLAAKYRQRFNLYALLGVGIGIGITVTIAVILLPWVRLSWESQSEPRIVAQEAGRRGSTSSSIAPPIGRVREGEDCVWSSATALTEARIPLGAIELTSGTAELRFASGTDVVLQAPCELVVLSRDSVKLVAGNVVVHVSEVSNGFNLQTPEADIIDEGTEYAVAIDENSTEVHVFDGSVIWIPTSSELEPEKSDEPDRIEEGEAFEYSHRDPSSRRRVLFDRVRFVRQLEADLRRHTDGELLAYDGFENLAGQLHRGRSGFGWQGGWFNGRRNRGTMGDVVDAPDDRAFGSVRTGRRLLQLANNETLRRTFERPLSLALGQSYFVSCLVGTTSADSDAERSLRISLEERGSGYRRQRGAAFSFGVNEQGFPFINSGSEIRKTAFRIDPSDTLMLVLRVEVKESATDLSLRVFTASESTERVPETWTVQASGELPTTVDLIRLTAGGRGEWNVDELKVATSWQALRGR